MKKFMFITIYIIFLVISVFFINENLKVNNELALLEAENKLIQGEKEALQFHIENVVAKRQREKEKFEEALELERIKTYIKNKPDEEYVAGYLLWEEANILGEFFYDDSEGKFKRDWGKFLALEAIEKDIDPLIVYELIRVETGGTFNPNTIGPQTQFGRAYGLAQFMKNTGPWVAEMADLPYYDSLLFDPLYSIQLAVTYLDFLYKQYDNWDYALTAYHRGIYGLKNYIEQNGHGKSWYAVEIQEAAENQELLATN
ncbi:transglycosylase SLT domain-containing protein [Evansella sp. AB-P1]|uniref:lytic transglycosylase domain-containing protein n=1 Tax=Evansella sp. AB-P1 TaxID=3037653 RepID=UPI00241E6172|nr:transglycosylase SLT domain-containing protein [Evansella sp. AB-P1]MDG5789856.1 transglycosylase SLT domain-containing protein [Evansella sp. AB-P1]